ncbi:MAG: allantoinase, partial [Chthoniobacterales bacterium]|nr:allantoinase [Chthoniobacterales bacterium]
QVLLTTLREVSTIGSDHSPSPPEMKEQENFFRVWGGISGCQHLLPLLIECEVTREEIARLTSRSVAELFQLPGKGEISVGNDADFSLVEMNAAETVTAESLHYRHGHSPYVGRKLRARVVRTFLRGETVFQDGLFAARTSGRFVRPRVGFSAA